jgi:hypothetical protein
MVNEHWDDLDRAPSEEGLRFAREYLGWSHPPNCHAVQAVAVFYDRFKEKERGDGSR